MNIFSRCPDFGWPALRRSTTSAARLALLSFAAALAHGDTLRLPSGELLIGRVVDQSPATIVFESRILGRLNVPAAGVEVIRGGAPENAAAAPAASAAVAATAAAPGAMPPPGAGGPPPPSWVRKKLGLPPAFSGTIEAGVDVMNAEVKMRDYTFEVSLGWKTEKNEYQTHHTYEDMLVQGARVTHTYEHGARWIRHLNPRWMWLTQVDWRRDAAQGVAYQVDAVTLPAYYFVKSDRFNLLGGAGLNHEWHRWDTPGAKADEHVNLAAYEVMRYKFTPTLSLRQTFLGYVDPEESDSTRYVFQLGLRQRLGAGLSLMLNYERRHESEPAPGVVENQTRFTTKLGYEF